MVAGGELFKTTFHLDYWIGIWLTAGGVILYTLFGGFLAVSWTDFVQGPIMFIALILMPIVVFVQLGGIAPEFSEVSSVDPALLLQPFKGATALGILSLLAWGLDYFGQPHIIVSFIGFQV